MEEDKVVHSLPEILGGIPVFIGTRVPATAFFDYIEDGDSIDDFLTDFPSVSKEQVVALLSVLRKDTMNLQNKI